jgi:hypothetical protein
MHCSPQRTALFLALFLTLSLTLAAMLFAQGSYTLPPSDRDVTPTDRTHAASIITAKAADFSRPVIYGTGGYYAASVASGDFNGDHNPDIAIANSCQSSSNGSNCDAGGVVGVLFGSGDGTLQQSVSYISGGSAASSIAVADLNGDGYPDIVVANQCISVTDCNSGDVGVLLNNGDGTFAPVVSYSAGYGTDAVAIADMNGDGIPDLVVANQCLNANSCNNGGVSVLFGTGKGAFQAPTTYSSGGQGAVSVAVRDVNGDGFPDVVVANQCASKSNCNNGEVDILLGSSNGALHAGSSYSSGGYSALSVAVADLESGGPPDIIVASLCATSANCVDGVVGILIGYGNGTFKPPVAYDSDGYGASSVEVADMNGDGIPDLVVDNICKTSSNCSKGGVALLLGKGDGTVQSPLLYDSDGNDATSVAAVDLNGDGKLDIVTADNCTTKDNCNGIVAVLLNSSLLKTTTVLASSANPAVVGQSVTFTATITSATSVPDGETVTFYQGSTALGTGTTSGGIATVSTSFSKSGSFTIKASYPGDAFHKPSSGKVIQVVTE